MSYKSLEPLSSSNPDANPEFAIDDYSSKQNEHGEMSKKSVQKSIDLETKERKQMILLLSGFVLLPILILGGLFVYRRVSAGTSTQVVQDVSTLTPDVSSLITPNDDDQSANLPDQSKNVTPTGTSRPSSPTATKTPTVAATTASQLANVYFHTASCTYQEGSVSAAVRPTTTLNGKEFTAATLPSEVTCAFIFQNSEDVQTGEILYTVSQNGMSIKTEELGTLKKGNYPNSEYKSVQTTFVPASNLGTNTVKIELNPGKKFAETNYSDNLFEVSYKVN